MPTPAYRTPVRIARGTYASLNASIADLLEGEICYATDQNKTYVVEGGALTSTQVDISSLIADVDQAQADILTLDSTKLDATTATSTYLSQASAASTYVAQADIDVTVQGYDADTVKQDVLPTFTVATRTTERTITSGAFDLATGNLWTVGAITVPNPTNAVAGQTGAIRITAGPVVWSSNFKFPGATAPTIATFPAIIPYYVQDSSTILMGKVVEGIT
jgi:hypothetical protein